MMRNDGNEGLPADEDLVISARAGNASAFERLVLRHHARLYNYIGRMTGHTADAEDLLQETFLRAYRHLDQFKEGARFRPWLYRIATNVCHDYWRSWRRRLRVFALSRPRTEGASPTRDAESPPGDTAPSPLPDPAQQAAEAEWNERLIYAVNALPLPHRAVFLMARYQGMTYREIGESLGIPEGTVKSRMNKAVHQLMQELGEAP